MPFGGGEDVRLRRRACLRACLSVEFISISSPLSKNRGPPNAGFFLPTSALLFSIRAELSVSVMIPWVQLAWRRGGTVRRLPKSVCHPKSCARP